MAEFLFRPQFDYDNPVIVYFIIMARYKIPYKYCNNFLDLLAQYNLI